jgi:tetratricopeptide (TPR) repeat protein
MSKKFYSGIFCVLTAVVLCAGCKPKPVNPTSISRGYFQTSFQSESQFIVEAIVSDLAEEIYYAANHHLPDHEFFSVTAKEKPSHIDAPVYGLDIALDEKHRSLKLDVSVNGPIWSPELYQQVVEALAQTVGLKPDAALTRGDTERLSELLDAKAETLEKENQALSAELVNGFTDPELHEQAALLLGAFMLREHSGSFFEIRSPLSRLTAHLVLARFFSGSKTFGVNGQLAQATMLTLVNDQAMALEELNSVDTKNSAVGRWVRALQARITGDFRPLAQATNRSPVEDVAWFAAMSDRVGAPFAWVKLSETQQQTIDFVRVAYEVGYSVEMGHQLLQAALPLELQEIGSVYKLSRQKELPPNGLIPALNEMPERCFTTGSARGVQVRVIGWGQWAAFFQRQLGHAMQQNFSFMYWRWGVPEDAKEFAAKCDQEFGGLRLYPFVRRFNCTDEPSYHKSVDDGFKVTVATPQLVSSECWNYLCDQVSFAPWYKPNPNPHINEWHNHNPPPGTVYDLQPRLVHPSLVNRPNAVARFEQLQQMAPCDLRVANFLVQRKYNNTPTFRQAMDLYQPMMPYSVRALYAVAATVSNQPDQYEKYVLQAAALSPACYYRLGDYLLNQNQTNKDQAALYYDKACDNDPDAVRAAGYAEWRMRYYLGKGDTNKAQAIADFAGDVYSAAGLQAKADFMEATSNFGGALEWFAKIEERYHTPAPLVSFCVRYKAQTGDTRFDGELEKRIQTLFPKGKEKVSLRDLGPAPSDGVVIIGQSDLLLSAGLKQGDVIVAIDGFRAHNLEQYNYVRDSQPSPELDLIVWQGDAYYEIQSSPPNHRFGVNIRDYQGK